MKRADETRLIALVHRSGAAHCQRVELVQIYQCFCDRTRLRILNLLCHGPLCVCHFQELLNEPQVKISKHLGYLKSRGLVEAQREANWMIYSLPKKPSTDLETNLACLQDCVREDVVFRRDLAKLKASRAEWAKTSPICSAKAERVVTKTGRGQRRTGLRLVAADRNGTRAIPTLDSAG